MAKDLTPEQIAEDIIREVESELLAEDSQSIRNSNTSSKRSGADKFDKETADGDATGDAPASGDSKTKKNAIVAKKRKEAEVSDLDNVSTKILSEMNDAEKEEFEKMTDDEKGEYLRSMKEEDEEGDEGEPECGSTDTEMIKKKVEESLSSDEMAEAISEHVDKLLEAQSDLITEEQKDQTALIFEAAVRDRTSAATNIIVEEVETILEARTEQIEEAFEAKYETLVDQVDSYLGYAVKEWMSENELAVESGLRTELAEDFIDGLKDLFLESYIDVPEERYDVLEEQTQEINDLRERLDEQISKNVEITQNLVESTRDSIIDDITSDMTDTEKERLHIMLEGVELDDEDGFKSKVNTLVESFFSDQNSTKVVETAISLNEEIVKESPQRGSLLEEMSKFVDKR